MYSLSEENTSGETARRPFFFESRRALGNAPEKRLTALRPYPTMDGKRLNPPGQKEEGFEEILLGRGLADERTVFAVNHFSHNGGWLYDEIARRTAAFGMTASCDGMTIAY